MRKRKPMGLAESYVPLPDKVRRLEDNTEIDVKPRKEPNSDRSKYGTLSERLIIAEKINSCESFIFSLRGKKHLRRYLFLGKNDIVEGYKKFILFGIQYRKEFLKQMEFLVESEILRKFEIFIYEYKYSVSAKIRDTKKNAPTTIIGIKTIRKRSRQFKLFIEDRGIVKTWEKYETRGRIV